MRNREKKTPALPTIQRHLDIIVLAAGYTVINKPDHALTSLIFNNSDLQ